MKKQTWFRFGFVVLAAAFAAVMALPSTTFGDNSFSAWLAEQKVNLGLDLAGGTELDYEIILDDAIAQNSDDDLTNDVNINVIAESVRDSLEARVNPSGVGETIVKRSSVNGEEHVLIQLPPGSNVDAAKRSAEKDNSLSFFEETPEKSEALKTQIAGVVTSLQNGSTTWDEAIAANDVYSVDAYEDQWLSDITPSNLREAITAASEGDVLGDVQETFARVTYEVNESGQLAPKGLNSFGRPVGVMGIPRVTAKAATEGRTTSSHILLSYAGASRAAENVPYATADEAKAKAEELLAQVLTAPETFAAVAEEFSTGPSSTSGGSLGVLDPNQLAPEFADAVFGKADEETGERPNNTPLGIIPNVVETEFGYHIINVTPKQNDQKVSYELMSWSTDDIVWTETQLGGAQLEKASVGYNEIGQPVVIMLLDGEGQDLFSGITERVAARSQRNECPATEGCRIGVKVGGNWVTQPRVEQKLFTREPTITGYTFDGAKQIADDLNLGAIDAPVRLSGQLTIQPELGADQLSKSLKAGLYGLLATMIFMVLMYRWAGLVASIALAIYAGLFIAVIKLWGPISGSPVVLSLAGVAGIALSIGLAVDANVLIFERIREELARGKNIYKAVELGFDRAWSAIRDSNITTLITCCILYFMGSSIVRGFAVTLIFGTLLSLFTAVTISRNLLRFGLLSKALHKPWLYGLSKKENK